MQKVRLWGRPGAVQGISGKQSPRPEIRAALLPLVNVPAG